MPEEAGGSPDCLAPADDPGVTVQAPAASARILAHPIRTEYANSGTGSSRCLPEAAIGGLSGRRRRDDRAGVVTSPRAIGMRTGCFDGGRLVLGEKREQLGSAGECGSLIFGLPVTFLLAVRDSIAATRHLASRDSVVPSLLAV